ncbi:MAG: hypothetical protein AMXMBFR16_10660 [Candidatus Uhrbacteria bacterium]
MPKLTRAKALEIKDLISKGVSQPEIAKRFNVSRSLVSDIATGRAWKNKDKDEEAPLPVKLPGGQRKGGPDYDPTDQRILGLNAEVAMLVDERNSLRRQVKAMTKSHGLFRAMSDELERVVCPMTALPPIPPVERTKGVKSIEEHLVMHLSDGHHDQIIRPEECGGLELYDFRISMRRAEQYIDTVLKWTQQTLAPQFVFPAVTVLAYGDHTCGEIHNATQRSYYRNQFKNCFAIGQLHALMYRDLAPYFKTVNVVYVPGNHGRRSLKKDYHGAHDNWDYLVAEVARLHCQDLKNVNFQIPDSFSVNLDINGIGFCVFHGDDIRSNLGIPWYGLERRQRRMIALSAIQNTTRIRYYCCGHFHRPGALTDVDGELIVNGAWPATDSYAYNSFCGFSEPSQLIHGVNPKYGITWRMPVKLRSENEHKGPQRYSIEIAGEV